MRARREQSILGKFPGVSAAIVMVATVMAWRVPGALFTSGDLIVSAYGSAGASYNQGVPSPINLIEYSISGGSALLTDTLPTTDGVGGSNNVGVAGQYGSSTEGDLQLSGDGQFLTLAAYSATAAAAGIQASTNAANNTDYPVGTPYGKSTISLAQSTDVDVPRVAVLIDGNGAVNSSTVLNSVYNTNNPRTAYSSDGSTFYISGQGDGNNADQGIFYGPTGLNTVSSPTSSPSGIYNAHETRFVTAYGGNLYYSIDTSSGSYTGIWQYNGLPTSSASATRIIPANNGKNGSKEVFYSPDEFYFANSSTLYVADTGDPKAGTLGDGGIQKWTLSGSTWTLRYTLTPTTSNWIPAGNPNGATSGESGFEAVTGEVVGTGAAATVELFAVSYTLGDDNPNGLYAINDTLDATSAAGESFTELEDAPGDGAVTFKGVSFAPTVPEPASLSLLSVASAALLRRKRRASV